MTDINIAQCEILGLCSPRSGSGSFSKYLKLLQLDVGHEVLRKNGIVSWWLSHHTLPDRKYRSGGTYFQPKYIIKLLRHPIKCISSLLLENEQQYSFVCRANAIKEAYNINLFDMPKIKSAIYSYLYWNEFIDLLNNIDFSVRIEYVIKDLQPIIQNLNLQTTSELQTIVVNKSINKFGTEPQKLKHEDIILNIDDKKTLEIYNKYMDNY